MPSGVAGSSAGGGKGKTGTMLYPIPLRQRSVYRSQLYTLSYVVCKFAWHSQTSGLFSTSTRLSILAANNCLVVMALVLVGCTASNFIKIIWCSRWFCNPPILRLCIALFAVAEGWLLLDIGWFVLFFFQFCFCARNFQFEHEISIKLLY